MRLLLVFLFCCCGFQAVAFAHASSPAHAATQPLAVSKPLNFKDWKSEKIQAVLNRITVLKAQMGVSGVANQSSPTTVGIKKSLAQEEWNLEIMKDLGVNDYFVLYLAPQNPNPERLLEVVQKLSPAEVASLMDAYARSLFSGSAERENGTARLPVQATERSGFSK
jgi:hypothetical protein